MMKCWLMGSLLLLSNFCFGQDWENVKLDDKISLRLPSGYQMTDSGGAKMWLVGTGACAFIVKKIPITPEVARETVIKNDDQLRAMYLYMLAQITESGEKVRHGEIDEIQGLLSLRIESEVPYPSYQIMIQETWMIYLSSASYSFCSVMPLDSEFTEKPKAQKEAFFSSIKIADGTTRENQYQMSGFYFKIGELIGSIAFFVTIGLIIALVLWLQRRKRKRIQKELQAREDGF